MTLSFHFASTGQEAQPWGFAGSDWAGEMHRALASAPHPLYRIAEQPESADLIVMCEPTQLSQLTWAPRLRAHPLVLAHPEKIYVTSEEDQPLGFFPGLYCSLPASSFDPRIHRTWIYRGTLNPFIAAHDTSAPAARPEMLAVFSGAASHPVRTGLFARTAPLARAGIVIRETASCRFNANPADPALQADQLGYINRILAAKFSICPRGTGTGSFRLQESMALGRAPVIISDAWVPVRGPDFSRCAVFVREAELDRLPDILQEHAPRWEEMGRLARAAWEQYFSPTHSTRRVLDQLADIAWNRPPGRPLVGTARSHRLVRREERLRRGPLLARLVRRVRRLFAS